MQRFLYLVLAALALFVGSQILGVGTTGRTRGAAAAVVRAEEAALAVPAGETWVDVARRERLEHGGVTSPSDPLLTEAAPPRWMALVQTERMRAAPPPPPPAANCSSTSCPGIP